MDQHNALTATLNGNTVDIRRGETILQLAERIGTSIPTLCNDERLAPAGACRTCLVEVDGSRRLVPACVTPAEPGSVIRSDSERVQRHIRTLLSLYLTDHPSDAGACETGAACDLHAMAQRYGVGGVGDSWPRLKHQRAQRSQDRNPYIEFRADRCILCARCTRYCDEVEGVSAIALTGRGAQTTISTVDAISLLDTSCELCGGCIDVCPTGAMTEKMPLLAAAPAERDLHKVRTTCNYCGVGCQMDLNVDATANDGGGRVVKVTSPPLGTLPNDGNLCVKGRFAYDFIEHPDRLTTPLIRGADGRLREASWEDALSRAAAGLLGVKDTYGPDALAFVSSSRCTGEENYLVQKIARSVFGTNNVHQCAAT